MPKPLVPDELWQIVQPLLPAHKETRRRRSRFRRGGRPPADDRAILSGILFVMRTGIPWKDLPAELHCGCGMTCWRRLRDWHKAGVFHELHRALLDRLNAAGELDWSRAVVDSASVRAVFGGRRPDPAPWTAGKQARNTTSSPTPTAPRWRRRSPEPTGMT